LNIVKLLRRFILGVTSIVILLILLIIVANTYILSTTSICEQANMSVYIDKRDRLVNTPSPKIILVGDSTIAYGIDSQQLEHHFNMPVVNIGINGSMGLLFPMELVKQHAREGDIVILSSSHKHWLETRQGNIFYGYKPKNSLWQILVSDFSAIQYMRHPKQLDIVMAQHIDAVETRIQEGLFEPQDCIFVEKKRLRAHYNANGDYVEHLTEENPNKTFGHILIDGATIPDDVLEMTNKFAKDVRAKDADLIYILPPYAESAYNNNKDKIDLFPDLMRANLDFPILGITEQFIYPDNQMFDTEYHLHNEGREINTQQIIELLERYLDEATN